MSRWLWLSLPTCEGRGSDIQFFGVLALSSQACTSRGFFFFRLSVMLCQWVVPTGRRAAINVEHWDMTALFFFFFFKYCTEAMAWKADVTLKENALPEDPADVNPPEEEQIREDEHGRGESGEQRGAAPPRCRRGMPLLGNQRGKKKK